MPIHPPDALSTLPPEYHVGTLDPTTAPAAAYEETEEEIRIRKAREALPHPEAALNLEEIEVRVEFRSNCSLSVKFLIPVLRTIGTCEGRAHSRRLCLLLISWRRRVQ